MNIFGRLLFKMMGESYSVDDTRLARVIGGGVTRAGKSVNDDSAMSLSAAWCCVRILSETIGTLPWAVYEDNGNGNLNKVKDHHLSRVLVDSPNANMTSVEYREAQGYSLCLGGNSYSFRDTARNGEVVALTPIEYGSVQAKQKDDGAVFYKVNDRGRWEDYPQEKIWHVKGFGRNGLLGLSPLAFQREAMGAALAQEEFGARFFGQGGFPSGIVTTDKQFKDKETRDIARESLNQMMGGLGNSHKFALFENGMKPVPWNTMPLEDMQFILSRKFSIQEICRFYRIPPHMVADLDRATFSNVEHLSQEFVMFTLMPYLTRIEASASKWLLRPGERRNYYLRFNYEGLLRADSAGRAAFYSTMLQNGVMNRNEARAKENMNRSDAEGMDDFTVQLNLAPVGDLGKVAVSPPGMRRATDLAPSKSFFESPPSMTFNFKDDRPVAPAYAPAPPSVTVTTPVHVAFPDAHFKAIMPEVKAPDVSVNVDMPDDSLLRDAMHEQTKALDRLADVSREAHAGLIDKFDQIKTSVEADRVAVFDKDGNPIGSKINKAGV